ncbi:MAG TPA: hypothetical protein P5291_06145, partial [Flavobacteriales bacterium]|nr:hypothetical protein [Flavobacteriales bacterium]
MAMNTRMTDEQDRYVHTMGVDVGASYVKVVLLRYDRLGQDHRILDKVAEKLRKRDPKDVVQESVDLMLQRHQLDYDRDIAYLASTGEGEMVARKTGHFY